MPVHQFIASSGPDICYSCKISVAVYLVASGNSLQDKITISINIMNYLAISVALPELISTQSRTHQTNQLVSAWIL